MQPYRVKLSIYEGLGNLPNFNPEPDTEPSPFVVAEFHTQLKT